MNLINTFLYHDVVLPGELSGFQRASHTPYVHPNDEFLAHLDMFKQSPIQPSLFTLQSKSGKHMMLTFDDGGVSSTHIAKLLETFGWRGYFFITTDKIGEPYFMSEEDIVTLHNNGHVIGSHSHTHPRIFTRLTYQEMLSEWNTSNAILSTLLGVPITHASIPGGTLNRLVQVSARDTGITHLFTSEPTLTPWKVNGMECYGRICPKQGVPLSRINKFINYKGYTKERTIRQAKTTIKRIIGRA